MHPRSGHIPPRVRGRMVYTSNLRAAQTGKSSLTARFEEEGMPLAIERRADETSRDYHSLTAGNELCHPPLGATCCFCPATGPGSPRDQRIAGTAGRDRRQPGKNRGEDRNGLRSSTPGTDLRPPRRTSLMKFQALIVPALAAICLSVARAQTPVPIIVPASNPATTSTTASAPQGLPGAAAASTGALLKTLDEMKAQNTETLRKQAALLESLNELQQAADQLRIYASRT